MTKQDILNIADDYRNELKTTLDQFTLPGETKTLIEEISRQTYYAISEICKALSELK